MQTFGNWNFYDPLNNLWPQPERLVEAVAAILICTLVGVIFRPSQITNKSLIYNIFIAFLVPIGDRLDRINRARTSLIMRGFFVLAVGVALCAGLYTSLNYLISSTYINFVHVLILALTLSTASIWRLIYSIYALSKQNIGNTGIYRNVAQLTRVDMSAMDEYGIARLSLGALPLNFERNLIAPIFWYWIGGLPLALVYAVSEFLSWRYGKMGFSKGFGAPALMVSWLMGFVPGLITAALLTLASIITPGASITGALQAWLRFAARPPFAQGGIALSVMAYSLNVTLGGPVTDINGSAMPCKWVGPPKASARVDSGHIKRALYMTLSAALIGVAVISGSYVFQ